MEKNRFVRYIKHPLYYCTRMFPQAKVILNPYQMRCGLERDEDIKIYLQLKRNGIKKDCKLTFFPVGDAKTISFFLSRKLFNICAFDFNNSKIEDIKKYNVKAMNIKNMDDFYAGKRGNILICKNLLESMNQEQRATFYERIKDQYRTVLFWGDYVAFDTPAHGPEPMGTFGCATFSNLKIKQELSDAFQKTYECELDKESEYLFCCS